MALEFICLEKTELAQNIANSFNKPLHNATVIPFADGEINVTLSHPELFKEKTVVVIQSTGRHVNQTTLAVAFLVQELKNAGATQIIGVIPYLGYSRQERSIIADKPGHAAVIARLLEAAGLKILITVQLHDEKIKEFFSIPVYNLTAESLIIDHIRVHHPSLKGACLVAPDQGARALVQHIAKHLNLGLLVASKQRIAPDQTRLMELSDGCRGTVGIIIDDIIATGGSAVHVAEILQQRGYRTIYGYFVHPVLASHAADRIAQSGCTAIFVGNTLPLPTEVQGKLFIKQFDVMPIIVPALKKIIG